MTSGEDLQAVRGEPWGCSRQSGHQRDQTDRGGRGESGAEPPGPLTLRRCSPAGVCFEQSCARISPTVSLPLVVVSQPEHCGYSGQDNSLSWKLSYGVGG